MDIQEVKAKLGVSQLNLTKDTNTEGQETGWMRMWDNDTRRAIVVHSDVVAQIQNGSNPNLGLKDAEIRTSKKTGEEYTMIAIVAYSNRDVDVTL